MKDLRHIRIWYGLIDDFHRPIGLGTANPAEIRKGQTDREVGTQNHGTPSGVCQGAEDSGQRRVVPMSRLVPTQHERRSWSRIRPGPEVTDVELRVGGGPKRAAQVLNVCIAGLALMFYPSLALAIEQEVEVEYRGKSRSAVVRYLLKAGMMQRIGLAWTDGHREVARSGGEMTSVEFPTYSIREVTTRRVEGRIVLES